LVFLNKICIIAAQNYSKMDNLIKQVQAEFNKPTEVPAFKAGDTVNVSYKIVEGNKERIQQFQGVVLQMNNATFTVRKISNGVGVERIFPFNSPFIDKVDLQKRGKVRRAKIFYIRTAKGKAAKIKEKITITA
jgi:large subunit ribosomal protein L19